jgi:hypothetical protein
VTTCSRCPAESTSTIRTDTEVLSLCCRCSDRWFTEWISQREEDGRYKVMSQDFHGNYDPDYIPYIEFQITGK